MDTDGWSDKIIAPSVKYGYPIDYKGYKARIITAQEIALITQNKQWNENSAISGFNFANSYNCPSSGCEYKYRWLYDRTSSNCVDFGCLNNASGGYGYWTTSVCSSSENHVWKVSYQGTLSKQNLDVETYTGIRPVIEVYKSSLK